MKNVVYEVIAERFDSKRKHVAPDLPYRAEAIPKKQGGCFYF